MAKDKEKKGLQALPYIVAAVVLTIVTIINMLLVRTLFIKTTTLSENTSRTMNSLNSLNGELTEINQNFLKIGAGVGDPMALVAETEQRYGNLIAAEKNFESIPNLPASAKKRFRYAKSLIDAYKSSLDALGTSRIEAQDEEAMKEAQNDIQSIQLSASEMIKATISIVSQQAGKTQAQGVKVFFIVEGIMLAVYFVSLATIIFIAYLTKRNKQAIAEREKDIAEIDSKLRNTRQKANDLAVTNILTGMKNRYALDNDVSQRLESDRFNIAVFDLDNFRSINDTYGYDFGDEYLAAVAEKLKEQFSGIAEIYNITGNEFCFLFNREISENQAMAHAQNIHAVMTSPYNVLNLTVQLPASGAVYHYLPGDCLNINSLLVKLDTAMRNVKMNGGNMITSVMNI